MFVCFTVTNTQSQLLKQIGDRVKGQVKARADRKVDDAINKTIDGATKKPANKDKTDQTKIQQTTQKENNPKENKTAETQPQSLQNNGTASNMEPQDGYIRATVFPDQTLVGALIEISGETMFSTKYKDVNISIAPPKGSTEPTSIHKAVIQKDGKFKFPFKGTEKEGDYTATVFSPDSKAHKKLSFTIYDFDDLDEIGEKIKELMDEASKNLKKIVDKMKDQAAPKDKKEVDEKMKDADENIEAGKKMLTSINEACGKLGNLAKEGKGMPASVIKDLGKLNDIFQKQEEVMTEQIERAKHEPSGNTICEYLTMLNEACAAFSTFTNLYGKTIMEAVQAIPKNVALDKGVPKGVEVANKNVNDVLGKNEFWAKESAKITATAVFDAGSLATKLGTAGVAGDLLQYAGDYLMKKYCVTYSGELKYHYENIYSHESNNWWKYTYDCGAKVSLRYPKNQSGGIIKMKGTIEGNATAFTFGFDVKHLLPKTITIYAQRNITPAIIPVVSSQNDALGFGAVARAIATPAYFYLTIDAEYNTQTEMITVFYNQALEDFSPLVSNKGLIMIIAAGIPIIKFIDFPINKMGLSFGSTLKRNSEFKMNSNGFLGEGKMSIGQGSAIEHKADFTMSVKKD